MKKSFLVACLVLGGVPALAQDSLEEVVVTGTRVEASVPGTSLKRPGDFILLNVAVSNDAREEKTRRNEIIETLRGMMAAAERDKTIELSVIGDNGLVLPLRLDSATLALGNGTRPETTQTTINVKTRIPANVGSSTALVARLKDFTKGIKPVGRTFIDEDGDFEISIVNPEQYRDRVVELFMAEVKRVTGGLGADYRVIVRGIDGPIHWVRDGMLEVRIFVPYHYDVLPVSISSYQAAEE